MSGFGGTEPTNALIQRHKLSEQTVAPVAYVRSGDSSQEVLMALFHNAFTRIEQLEAKCQHLTLHQDQKLNRQPDSVTDSSTD